MEQATRVLASVDWGIIILYGVISLLLGLWYTRKASKSVNDYFIGNRSLPWFLIGVSMAATNFSVDTPLAITKYVFQEGVGGVWFFWAFAMTGIITTFFFAKMWRRAEVMTDAEIIERRYSGSPAKALRIFKGCYFGIIINCFVMGWVFRAMVKVLAGLTNFNPDTLLYVSMAVVCVYVIASGIYGVVLTDFAQYIFALLGSFLLAYFSVREVGGLSALVTKLHATYGTESGVTNFVPSLSSDSMWMPLSVFLVYVGVQWWAQKYSDGGGKHIQRMSSAKNEKHSVYATFFFTIMNYAVQTWPWILVALCAIIIYGRNVSDPEMTYIWMMGRQLPTGVLGLMVVTLIAAFMSTISTHANLGGSYMINDLYRRFMHKNASEKHYILMSRIMIVALVASSMFVATYITSIGSAWKFILMFTSGAGLTFIIRWFWWRANAWTEFTGMISSGIISIYLYLKHPELGYAPKILITVGISTAAWLIVTLLTQPVSEERLVEFVRKVQPGSPGWKRIYRRNNIPYVPYGKESLINVGLGLVFFFSANFGMGSIVLTKYALGAVLLTLAITTFIMIIYRLQQEMGGKKMLEEKVLAPTTIEEEPVPADA